jgi:hypothetical protein
MSDEKSKLDRQINAFLALRGHDHKMVDWCQGMLFRGNQNDG